MANPQVHARSSVRKFGGHWTDYIYLHSFLDSSKLHWAKAQHRALLHHEVGLHLAVLIFGKKDPDGTNILPISGQYWPVKGPKIESVIEQHFSEDFTKYTPTIVQWWEGSDPELRPKAIRVLTLDELCDESVRYFGGQPEDYMKLHQFMDTCEGLVPGAEGITHSTFGLGLAELALGWVVGTREVPTRTVAEKHILAQFGSIPTAQDWLSSIPVRPWMYNQASQLSRELEEVPA